MECRRGFTILELVIVLGIGALVAGIAIAGFGGIQARLGVRAAEARFLSMHGQTRALAVERGRAVRLSVNPETGVVRIEEGCAGDGPEIDARDFGAIHAVTIETGVGVLWLCMTPRGFADIGANSFSQEARVSFVRGDRSATVVLLPLGQAVAP